MLHPSYTDLMSTINERNLTKDQLVSRYSIVIATAKRARQIVDGDEPLISKKSPRPLSNAVWELYEGLIDVV
ncbi:MAG: DNA-directed RNA polymerase subunit omega [Firmicutes bacterium HGW-Firmicutes-7]|nr:MAG: DNA-directed RNA polymerase subunit omega [Firmicutes bacterium HGW-Firmicutes-7]